MIRQHSLALVLIRVTAYPACKLIEMGLSGMAFRRLKQEWLLAVVVFASILSVPPQALAAGEPRINLLDIVPDKIPFDIPYGPPVQSARAQGLIAAAVAAAEVHGWKISAAVYDSGANMVAFVRMDGAFLGATEIAMHKARAAVIFRRDTHIFEDAARDGIPGVVSVDGVIASRGGFPLVENGELIGALGISGGTGSQDEAVAKAAIAGFGK